MNTKRRILVSLLLFSIFSLKLAATPIPAEEEGNPISATTDGEVEVTGDGVGEGVALEGGVTRDKTDEADEDGDPQSQTETTISVIGGADDGLVTTETKNKQTGSSVAQAGDAVLQNDTETNNKEAVTVSGQTGDLKITSTDTAKAGFEEEESVSEAKQTSTGSLNAEKGSISSFSDDSSKASSSLTLGNQKQSSDSEIVSSTTASGSGQGVSVQTSNEQTAKAEGDEGFPGSSTSGSSFTRASAEEGEVSVTGKTDTTTSNTRSTPSSSDVTLQGSAQSEYSIEASGKNSQVEIQTSQKGEIDDDSTTTSSSQFSKATTEKGSIGFTLGMGSSTKCKTC